MNSSIIRRPFIYQYYNAAFGIIILNILFFLINMAVPRTMSYLALNPVLFVQKRFYWQVITYMFVHANMSHILFNMLALFFFGLQLEKKMGSSEFLLYYFASGIGAGLFSLLVYWLTGAYQVWLLGASGAVFAILLAFATYFPDSRIYVMGIFPVKATHLVIGYTAIELLSQIFSYRSGVAHLTHLAGFGFGLIYFLVRLRINPIKVFLGDNRYYN